MGPSPSTGVDFAAHYREWLGSAEVRELTERLNTDINAVPHVESLTEYAMPAQTLEQSVAQATDVVIGRVQNLAFACHARVLTFQVERSFKNQATSSIELSLGGGLEQGQSGTAVLVDDDAQPQYPVGTRLALIIERIDDTRYGVFPFTGSYELTGGIVATRPGNPEYGRLNGLPEPQLVATIETALR